MATGVVYSPTDHKGRKGHSYTFIHPERPDQPEAPSTTDCFLTLPRYERDLSSHFEESPTASNEGAPVLKLPAEVLGTVYKLLTDRKDQVNLSYACRSIHSARGLASDVIIRLTNKRLSDLHQASSELGVQKLYSNVGQLKIDLSASPSESTWADCLSSQFDLVLNTIDRHSIWRSVKSVVLTLDTCKMIHASGGTNEHPVLKYLSGLPSLKHLGLDRLDTERYAWYADFTLLQLSYLHHLKTLEEITIRYTGRSSKAEEAHIAARPDDGPRRMPLFTVTLFCTSSDEDGQSRPIRHTLEQLAATIRSLADNRHIGTLRVVDATSLLRHNTRSLDHYQMGEAGRLLKLYDGDNGSSGACTAQAIFTSGTGDRVGRGNGYQAHPRAAEQNRLGH